MSSPVVLIIAGEADLTQLKTAFDGLGIPTEGMSIGQETTVAIVEKFLRDKSPHQENGLVVIYSGNCIDESTFLLSDGKLTDRDIWNICKKGYPGVFFLHGIEENVQADGAAAVAVREDPRDLHLVYIFDKNIDKTDKTVERGRFIDDFCVLLDTHRAVEMRDFVIALQKTRAVLSPMKDIYFIYPQNFSN